jgi:hypothetical protein
MNLKNLFVTNEPGLGRVLRTSKRFEQGDLILEEAPYITFSCKVSGKFERRLEKFVRKYEVANYEFPLHDDDPTLAAFLSSMLTVLQETPERVEFILSYFYQSPLNASRYENLRGCVIALYDEVRRLLAHPEYATQRNIYSSAFNVDSVLSIFNIFSINSCEAGDNTGALFRIATLIAHDCAPNCVYDFDQLTECLRLSAIEPIEEGSTLKMSYLSLENNISPTKIRREHLYAVRLFWCYCDRCLEEDLTRTLPCPNSASCSGFISTSLRRVMLYEPHWLCNTCKSLFWGLDLMREEDLIHREVKQIIREEYRLMKEVLETRFSLSDPDSNSSAVLTAKLALVRATLGDQHWLSAHYHLKISELPSWQNQLSLVAFGHWALKYLPPYRCLTYDAGLILLSPHCELHYDPLTMVGLLSTGLELLSYSQRGPIAATKVSLQTFLANLQTMCSCCGKEKSVDGTALLACARCRKVVYCGKECQIKDWRARHRLKCVKEST